jgi:hypothetical protein
VAELLARRFCRMRIKRHEGLAVAPADDAHAPYAQAIACGLKRIETRGQRTRYRRGCLAIHAALDHGIAGGGGAADRALRPPASRHHPQVVQVWAPPNENDT